MPWLVDSSRDSSRLEFLEARGSERLKHRVSGVVFQEAGGRLLLYRTSASLSAYTEQSSIVLDPGVAA